MTFHSYSFLCESEDLLVECLKPISHGDGHLNFYLEFVSKDILIDY